ncbi:MAG: response regulator transcription factor [Propionibacteriaceae bacterium]|nr:response regulator transcription factor [Propionibacteriaceae bacterium]
MAELLLVEDSDTVRETLSVLLKREGHQVRTASDGLEAVEEFDAHTPDLVLLDLMLPGMPGIEVCRQMRATSSVPIIIVSAKDQEADIINGLENGADDYVTKPFSTPQLLARIRSALRRQTAIEAAPTLLHASGITMDLERHQVLVDGREVELPLREFTLLELFIRNAGRVLTRDQLISRVWGADYFGDTKTLDVHVRRIRSRIEPDPKNPTRLITVRGLGYRLNE